MPYPAKKVMALVMRPADDDGVAGSSIMAKRKESRANWEVDVVPFKKYSSSLATDATVHSTIEGS